MCFDPDSRPPIPRIAGGALDSSEVTLSSTDGTPFSAFRARPAEPTGAAVLILPDVRGLHTYYEDLAERFAEHGVDALAIDYFGRTAGLGRRQTGFDHMRHVEQLTFAGLAADIEAAVTWLRVKEGVRGPLVVVGFCFGGRLAFVSGTLGLDLTGVVGFYGKPVGEGRAGVPAPADVAARLACPVLGLFGGADESIHPADVETFEAALRVAGVEHRLISYPGAPHSFFDRKADEFVRTSGAAWDEVLAFIRARTASAASA